MSRTRKIIKEFGKVRVFLVVFTICLGLYLIFNLLWFGKILPGTKVGVFNFGGRNSAQAEALLAEVMDTYQGSNTTFLIKGEEVDVPISDLGIRFDKSATLDAINRNRFVSLGDFLRLPRAFFGEVQINAVYSVDYNQFQNALGNKFSAYETKATNAAIVEGINGLEITQEKEGIVIDKSRLVAQLKENLSRIDGAKIQVSLVPDSPRITSAQLVKVKDKLAKLAQQTFVFNYGFDSWNLKWQDIQNLIVVDLPNTSGGYVTALKFGTGYTIEDLQVADTEKSEAQILLNHDKANEFLIGIAKSIDQQKVDATLKFENGRIAQFSPAIDGQELDRNAVLEQIGRKIATDEIASNKIISFKLPVNVTRAKVDNEEVNKLGIRELVGRGISYFAGSIANRAFNVQLGASRVNGALIAPGEVFSFNKTVGEVTAATGYKQAYVISAGHTVLDDGGGICQVSTTVFRAALNAGLPIISRTGHAYRVGYYEQRGFKPGLDATVFSPSVDFMFKNDTDHHILLQTIYDPVPARLEVDLYGTQDGRRVEQSEPIVTNETAPPPDKREDDPTQPKGTIKQVDFSAWGASAYFTRKVYKNDRLIIDDVFRTNYRPWQAVFLVGTAG